MGAPTRPEPWQPPSPLPCRRETPRLVLRWLEPGDAPALVAALDEDRSSFEPWLPWVKLDNRNEAEAVFNAEKFRRERERTDPPADNFVMTIADRSSGEVVGGTGFHRLVSPWHEAEIGYWVRPSRRGQGVCTEAVAHLIDWAFEPPSAGGWGFRRIHIQCAALNVASRRVPEKLGVPLESNRLLQRWEDGLGWCDALGFGVTAEAWAARVSRAGRSS